MSEQWILLPPALGGVCLFGAPVAGVAAAALALAPGSAEAKSPTCDEGRPDHRPALTIKALPRQIAPNRDIPFVVAPAPKRSTPAVYRGGGSVIFGRPHELTFYTEYYFQGRDEREIRRGGTLHWIRMRAGEGPATVTVRFTQRTPTGLCRATVTRTVTQVAPRPARVRLRAGRGSSSGELRLSMTAAGGCWRGEAGTTKLRLSGSGRGVTLRLSDLCDRWNRSSVRLPGLAISALNTLTGGDPTLRLRADDPRRRYRLTVEFEGRTLLRRDLLVAGRAARVAAVRGAR